MATKVDNSKLLNLVLSKIKYYDENFSNKLVFTEIYYCPNDKLGVALAELASYLEILCSSKNLNNYANFSRAITYNTYISYDNLDSRILDDYEKFCSVFLDF